MPPPRFPVEVWREILRISTAIPGSLETKWDHSPDLCLWQGWHEPTAIPGSLETMWDDSPDLGLWQGWHDPTTDYKMNLQTKRSIVQVSKSWRDIGVEFLFEHLYFGEEDEELEAMANVASILEQHSNESGYGRATKHIDIPIRALTPPCFPILMRLLNSCHNLRVLIMERDKTNNSWRCDPADISNFASLLPSRFSHSLRRMSSHLVTSRSKGYNTIVYHRFFPNIPLESLEISTDYLPAQEPFAIGTVSALTIYIGQRSIQMPLWQCPALRHLALIGIRNYFLRVFFPLLDLHGPKLLSLALIPAEGIRNISDPNTSPLIARAPNLRCLVFDLSHAATIARHVIFPSITHIGIRTQSLYWKPNNHFDRPAPASFNPSWFPPNSIFPNLECLRFLDNISYERPHWLWDIARDFEHVRVEDKHCRPMS